MKQNVPFVPQRYFDFTGLPDAGGWIWVYLKGTSTPATSAIWYDADGLVAGANPIPLDSAGQPEDTGAFYLDPGAYTLKLFGADGVQIGPPVDAIVFGSAFGGGSEIVAQGNAIIVKTYAGVRGLIEDWDAVYVCGRAADGDGGEGWFQRVPTSTETDDDGICLVAGSNRFIRTEVPAIDPLWYGLVYGGTVDQWPKVAIVGAASDHWVKPVQFAGSVYLGQNGTISSGWSLRCDAAASFVSATGLPVTLTFQGGSEFDGVGVCFGPEVQPVFALGVVPAIPLSWMGGVTGDQRLAKWAASSTVEATLLLDDEVTTATLPTFSSVSHLDRTAGKITLTAAANLSVDVVYQGLGQWFEWSNVANIGSVYIGERSCRPEWFGARGNNTTDDGLALRAAAKTGDIVTASDRSYRTTIAIATAPLVVRGDGMDPTGIPVVSVVTDVPSPRIFMDPPSALNVINLGAAGSVAFQGVSVALSDVARIETNGGQFRMARGVARSLAGDIKSDQLILTDAVVRSMDMFTASDEDQIFLDNVRDDTDTDSQIRRRYKNRSQFKKVYLEEEANTSTFDRVLTTDADGLVGGKNSLRLQALELGAGMSLDTKIVSASTYTVDPSDPPVIIFTGAGYPTCVVTLPATVGAGEPTLRLLALGKNVTGSSEVQVNAAECWTPTGITPSFPLVADPRMGSWFAFVNGKWVQL